MKAPNCDSDIPDGTEVMNVGGALKLVMCGVEGRDHIEEIDFSPDPAIAALFHKSN